MNFLNRVHFDAPMAPLDLEIYHQLKNVIGVDPKLYEYILMVDADTEVMSDALTRLVAVMTRDAKVIGLCGETQLSNENQSITTMMQVYEYYISHHLAKAFESLFGAVTCLPGCFCMYRIRTLQGRPLIISNSVIQEYSENVVDTLHKKNLLHLGEDRYLTTLILKHFPSYKMKFTPDAQCKTVAPDQFAVLLSQRRRWINSTIHNLFELIFLNEMCGFCCFSMRFVVFLDLIGTLILPATVIYLVYIIVAASTGFQYISTISVIIMCSTYILQALIFILKQQWQHVGWMVFYLLGMGLFNFYIPIYSYWHFDDFSWGNTRVVVGEDGVRQIIAANETEIEPFDPSTIPMVRWSEHQNTVWETVSNSPPPFGSYSQLPSPVPECQLPHLPPHRRHSLPADPPPQPDPPSLTHPDR
ncbi:Chitin synthase, class 6 [Entomophthora muscae]|uniref:Chitin synthase, class 6 n=1 Tax=Entomophthora muscae TaxID=34485 RepID=A0ACC2RHJ1_9FUNG|nr:Chitin synthase, class 6 [Entomophthora muscae]